MSRKRVSAFRSKNLQAKKRKTRMYKVAIIGTIFLAVVFGLSFLTRAAFFQADNVVVQGNGLIKKEVLEEIVKKPLRTSFAWIFQKNNIGLYPRSAVTKEILAKF